MLLTLCARYINMKLLVWCYKIVKCLCPAHKKYEFLIFRSDPYSLGIGTREIFCQALTSLCVANLAGQDWSATRARRCAKSRAEHFYMQYVLVLLRAWYKCSRWFRIKAYDPRQLQASAVPITPHLCSSSHELKILTI